MSGRFGNRFVRRLGGGRISLAISSGPETPQVGQDTGDQTTSGATSDTASFSSDTTTNNGIIVLFALKNGARVSSVSDNKSNTYTRIGFAVDVNDAVVEMWACQPITGGASHQLTVTYDQAAYVVWGAMEITHARNGAWYDSNTLATVVGDGGDSDTITITSGTPRAKNELFVAMVGVAGGGSDADISTPTTGYTEVVLFNDYDSVMAGEGAHKTQSPKTATSATWTTGTTADPYAAIIAGFRGTGSVIDAIPSDILTLDGDYLYVDGTPLTLSLLQTPGVHEAAITEVLYDRSTKSRANVYNASSLTGVNATSYYAIPWANEVEDTDGWHSTSSNTQRLTVPSGVSYVDVEAFFSLSSITGFTTQFVFRIVKNGTTVPAAVGGYTNLNNAGAVYRTTVSAKRVPVSPGDYFTASVLCSGDTSITIDAVSYFRIRKAG